MQWSVSALDLEWPQKPAQELTNMNGICRLFDTVIVVIEHLPEEVLGLWSANAVVSVCLVHDDLQGSVIGGRHLFSPRRQS